MYNWNGTKEELIPKLWNNISLEEQIKFKNIFSFNLKNTLNFYFDNLKDKKIIDFGSGFGHISKPLSKYVEKIYCLDISEDMLNQAKEYCKDMNNIEYIQLKNFKLPFEDNSIDIIFSLSVFIHLNVYDTILYMKEFKRIIKKDGLVLLDFYNDEQIFKGLKDVFEPQLRVYEETNGEGVKENTTYYSLNNLNNICNYIGFKIMNMKIDDSGHVYLYLKK